MYCAHCGKELPENATSCPECQAPVSHSHFLAKKKWPFWLKLLLALIFIGIILSFFMIAVTVDPKESLEKHLNAVRTNQLTEAYYDYTTKDFQNAVSLEKFKEFIKSNENIFKSVSPLIESEEGESGLHIYRITFKLPDQQTVQLNYQLKDEGGDWKIQDIKLANIHPGTAFDSSELLEVITKFLHDLKKGEVKGAYEHYTSKSFKEATSLEAFKQFLSQYPLFTNDPAPNFSNLSFRQGVANFKGTLTNSDQHAHQVEFDLIQEDGEWKIVEIQLFSKQEKKVIDQ